MVCPMKKSGSHRWRIRARDSAIFGNVQPAFLFLGLLPPPASRALRLARRDRARARSTADRQEAAIMQRVVRNVVCAYEFERPFACPVEQRINFDELAALVERRRCKARSVGGLIGTNAGDP